MLYQTDRLGNKVLMVIRQKVKKCQNETKRTNKMKDMKFIYFPFLFCT